jgi:protein-L-isoaspartate(D-aspartate) O-methyltransferase
MSAPDDWHRERDEMLRVLRAHGIRDERILAAMGRVRRHAFIPERHRLRHTAYGDYPWEIGHGQTISQPYIVAYMIERLALQPGEKVLEIGAGSGYEAAVLAELGMQVFSIEVIPELAEYAGRVLAAEGYGKARVLSGDGYKGWPEHAPYDAVIASCAPEEVPPALVEQLRDGGRMIVPVGVGFQALELVLKRGGRVERRQDLPVRFVPMVRGR